MFAAADSWCAESGRNLLGTRITVLGGGGITRSLIRLLEPWGCQVTWCGAPQSPSKGAARTLTLADVHEAVAGADAVVVALALTDETRGVVDTRPCWRPWGRSAGW